MMFSLQRFSAGLITYDEYTANFFDTSNSQTDTIKSISIDGDELIIHKSDGTEENIQISGEIYDKATVYKEGLMSAEDKFKLDSIDYGTRQMVVDTAISDKSNNPIGNKTVKKYIDDSLRNVKKEMNSTFLKTVMETDEGFHFINGNDSTTYMIPTLKF